MTIGIALSGGGTRGVLHIGVLQALHDNGIVPEVVSGTSAGSIVGALYTHGYAPDEIKDIATRQSLLKMINLKVPNKGFIRHVALRKLLEKFLPSNSFHGCKKPFYVAVTNLHTGKVEVYSEGPMIDYVIASSSVPILFEPVDIDGSLYVDGGLVMNLPAKPIKDKCDLLIGVNLVPLTQAGSKDLNSLMSVGIRCFDLAAINNIMPQLKYCDAVVAPRAINDFSRYDFKRFEDMYRIGYEATEEMIPEIKEKIKSLEENLVK